MALYIGPWQEYKLSRILNSVGLVKPIHESEDDISQTRKKIDEYFTTVERLHNISERFRVSHPSIPKQVVTKRKSINVTNSKIERVNKMRALYLNEVKDDSSNTDKLKSGSNLFPSDSLSSLLTSNSQNDHSKTSSLLTAGQNILACEKPTRLKKSEACPSIVSCSTMTSFRDAIPQTLKSNFLHPAHIHNMITFPSMASTSESSHIIPDSCRSADVEHEEADDLLSWGLLLDTDAILKDIGFPKKKKF
eukprot:GDKK01077089.1.p1 GENE.GDKK01077089.1~~GDKK01077089.1.p1  ORF type:complete len:249 (+),score=12.28 GDKK01077089.1:30-776(+)